jgi:hypothetical protein
VTTVHEALVLCPSCVPENVDKNKNVENQNYSHRRNNGGKIDSGEGQSYQRQFFHMRYRYMYLLYYFCVTDI